MTSDLTQHRSGVGQDKDWFLEGTVPGRRFGNLSHGFKIDQLVYEATTPFQECLIFDNPVYGRVLVLDGIVQLSTFDEHIYHEMIVHPPMFSHPEPKRVLIVGGGDGGTLREVLKHNPEEVVMIDIDRDFVYAAQNFLPSLSDGAFEDERVQLVFADAFEELKKYNNHFDVAIIDCNDAVGTSEPLFEAEFFSTVKRSMRINGVCSMLAGSLLDPEFILQTRERMESIIGITTGIRVTIPCYHCGEFVFLMASGSGAALASAELEKLQVQRSIVTQHWSPVMQQYSHTLPPSLSLW